MNKENELKPMPIGFQDYLVKVGVNVFIVKGRNSRDVKRSIQKMYGLDMVVKLVPLSKCVSEFLS